MADKVPVYELKYLYWKENYAASRPSVSFSEVCAEVIQ